ncbi:hypothetical protein G4B88_022844 [Cannabis sativa]|uniref:DNA/RNA-binding protein Alba-like domain-containing protein n=1 Tax=Cannabis sativa TaxID=3483 RepID=A0A7J6HY59_CANSA|nr:hypothetical protein G4B88_022844 [Cannabis sativa]
MEEITDGVNNMNVADSQKRNRIQVSNTKKPLFFYVNLAKRYMQQYNEVELSALGMEITDGVNNMNVADSQKRNRIQVSNTKKPLFFYVNLAKRYMQQYNEVELSALGMAIATVVTIAEILKNNGLALEKKIMTSTVDIKDDSRGRPVQKAKIEILLGKTANFDELMAAAQEEKEAREAAEEQS